MVGDTPPAIDGTLICSIVRARKWYAGLCEGNTFTEIARREGTSKRRVQDIVDLTFLSPDLLKQLVAGTQPSSFTTDTLIKTGFPILWAEQHAALAAAD